MSLTDKMLKPFSEISGRSPHRMSNAILNRCPQCDKMFCDHQQTGSTPYVIFEFLPGVCQLLHQPAFKPSHVLHAVPLHLTSLVNGRRQSQWVNRAAR